jgi:hypothetical protein
MADPPIRPVVPLGEHLFQPLHDSRKFQPVRRFNVKRQPVIRKTQPANLENKPEFRLPEYPGEQYQGFIGDRPRSAGPQAEQRFPVVDAGMDFVTHPLFEYTQRSHGYYMRLIRRFALVKHLEISNSEQIPLKIPLEIFADHVWPKAPPQERVLRETLINLTLIAFP